MSINGYTRASSEKVWASWVNAQGSLVKGATGFKTSGTKKIPYEIIDVVPGKSFSVSWKALFVRLVFSHEVFTTATGAKIRANLALVLKAFIKQLESN